MYSKINFLTSVVLSAAMCLTISSCESETEKPKNPPKDYTAQGVLILNQGGAGYNNAGLSLYDLENDSVFGVDLGEPLGDTAQDMLRYGNKLYITVAQSSYVRVLSADSLKTVKKIGFFNGEVPRQPRYLATFGGYVYVSCWDGSVARIDTVSLTIDERKVATGHYPEGMAVCGDRLYVANASFYDDTDSTLSVIDLNTFSEIGRITVGLNPNIVKSDDERYVYVSYQGNFGMPVAGGFQRIDTQNDAVLTLGEAPTTDYALSGGYVYFYNVIYDANWNATNFYGRYSVSGAAAGATEPIFEATEAPVISPYGIAIAPNGKLYIADANDYSNNGKIVIFDAAGKKIAEHTAGIAPCKFVFR